MQAAYKYKYIKTQTHKYANEYTNTISGAAQSIEYRACQTNQGNRCRQLTEGARKKKIQKVKDTNKHINKDYNLK